MSRLLFERATKVRILFSTVSEADRRVLREIVVQLRDLGFDVEVIDELEVGKKQLIPPGTSTKFFLEGGVSHEAGHAVLHEFGHAIQFDEYDDAFLLRLSRLKPSSLKAVAIHMAYYSPFQSAIRIGRHRGITGIWRDRGIAGIWRDRGIAASELPSSLVESPQPKEELNRLVFSCPADTPQETIREFVSELMVEVTKENASIAVLPSGASTQR